LEVCCQIRRWLRIFFVTKNSDRRERQRDPARHRRLAQTLLDSLPRFFSDRREAREKEAEELEQRVRDTEEQIKKGARRSDERFRL
jgi:acyl carrier protein phosphodiesterase